MRIFVNGMPRDTRCKMISDLKGSFPDHDVVILNGHCITGDVEIKEGDTIHFSSKTAVPNETEFESLLAARHTPKVHEKVKGATVGIAGLGGLGSNIAAMLTRLGIGKLVIADMDTVEPTNLNRQNYFVDDIGKNKTDATRSMLKRMNPFVKVEEHTVKLDPENIREIFKDCSIVCEAFDSVSEKVMLVNTISEELPDVDIIVGSGMAGYFDSNLIRTEKRTERIHICGDGVNDAKPGSGLMAPRVGICAGHMANAVLRILMGEEI